MKEKTKNYLFVCYANIDRSPTAEEVCRALAQRHNVAIHATSAGVSAFARQPMTEELANQADLIFVMEEYMKDHLVRECEQDPAKIIILGIPDIYARGDFQLVRILREALIPYMQQTPAHRHSRKRTREGAP